MNPIARSLRYDGFLLTTLQSRMPRSFLTITGPSRELMSLRNSGQGLPLWGSHWPTIQALAFAEGQPSMRPTTGCWTRIFRSWANGAVRAFALLCDIVSDFLQSQRGLPGRSSGCTSTRNCRLDYTLVFFSSFFTAPCLSSFLFFLPYISGHIVWAVLRASISLKEAQELGAQGLKLEHSILL